jgi:AcrR family transcriptional regulator
MKAAKSLVQTTEETKPGRPRSATLRKRILQAALALLQKNDLQKVSVEGIAARAKVGKTTIYRWWPNKSAVIMEAFLETVAPGIRYPQTNHPLDDVIKQMKGLSKSYGRPPGQIFLHLIAQAQFDDELADELRKYVLARRSDARAALKRAVDKGLLRSDIDLEVTLDQLYAPIFYRLLAGYARVDDDFIEEVFRQVLEGAQSSKVSRSKV